MEDKTNIKTILSETTYISIALTLSIAIGAYYIGTLANSIESNKKQIETLQFSINENQKYYSEISQRLSRIEGILQNVKKN